MTHSARTARTRTVRHEFLHARLRTRLLKSCVHSVRAPLPPPSSVVVADLFVTSVSAWSRPSSSSVSGDGFWKRALAGLPVALADGLRTAELDDPTVLCSYPRMDWEEAFTGLRALSCTMDVGVAPAPSGASSSGQPTTPSLQLGSTSLPATGFASTGTTCASLAGNMGTDPKTGLSCVGVEKGGDPRTVQFVPSGGNVKTDQAACAKEKGGDPRTDRVKDSRCSSEMAATCPPYRPGRLATATAMSISSATASAMLAADVEHSDGFPNSSAHRDELPSSACEAIPDGSSLLDRILHRRHSIGILRDFHSGESSESLRQSQLDQVQIVPATLIPSELSAHQMAARSDGSLARPRVDGHPTSALSLQDKVLLRKYSIPVSIGTSNTVAETNLVKSERDGCTIRSEGPQRAEDRVEQTTITALDSTSRDSTGSAGQILTLSPKDSELPNAGETDPKRRRRIGKAGAKKETKEDSASITKFQVPSWCQNIPLDSSDFYVAREYGVTDMVLLYITLVSDGAIPAGFLAEFLTLEQALNLSSKRAINIAANRSDAEAERLSFIDKKRRDMQALTSSAASDQLVLAAELKPRKFRSKWQRIVFEGPTARKDMEDAERARWVASLGDLLRHTDTPMGRLLRENPSNLQLLGSGLRAGTLRSRVRSIKKFLEWLSVAHKIAFLVHWQQFVEFLQVRLSEPCVRGSLKSAHRSLLFLQESAGISDKLTDSA